jgi:hypothetical protein
MRGHVFEFDCTHGWNDGEGEDACPRCAAKGRMVAELAQKWNQLTALIEQREWGMSRDQRDDYADYLGEMIYDKALGVIERLEAAQGYAFPEEECRALIAAEEAKLWEEERKRQRQPYEDRAAIEEMLGDMGARMMRPYEHWNEDERMMEYMENRASRYADDWSD